MSIKFEHSDKSLSNLLANLARSVKEEGFSLHELLKYLGERGLLMLILILTVPFLLPVSIPGTGVPFGLVISLIAMGIVTNRAPWLPDRLMSRRLSADKWKTILNRGAQIFLRIEKWTHPRLLILTHGITINRFNGILIIVGALLLMAPLPVPMTNLPPAYGVLFLTLGSIERDGYLIIAGYLTVLLTIILFTLITMLGVSGVTKLLGY
jgi:hypothetical protein